MTLVVFDFASLVIARKVGVLIPPVVDLAEPAADTAAGPPLAKSATGVER